jgi:hypothetical protein
MNEKPETEADFQVRLAYPACYFMVKQANTGHSLDHDEGISRDLWALPVVHSLRW